MGENSEPIAFSRSHCHMNESEHCHLAGERYIIHVGQDNEHMEACTDCYLKHHGVYEEQNDWLRLNSYNKTIKRMESENNDYQMD